MKRRTPPVEDNAQLSGVNVIPIIDVCLVLLIILLATSPMLNLPGFEVKLPKALTAESKEKNVTISLGIKGELGIDDKVASWENVGPMLRRELTGEKKDFLVIIRADQGVQYGQVEQLMDIAKTHGAKRIAIATQQQQEKVK